MKKIISLLSIALIAISCSDTDPETPASNSGPVSATQTQYDNFGNIESINVFEYQNGKPDTFSFYTAENELEFYQKFFYSDGKVNKIIGYTATDAVSGQAEYFYDSQQRLYKITTGGESYSEQTLFTYNGDGSITGVATSSDGYTEEKTWLVSANGYIYKEIDDNSSYELAFDGATGNPLTGTYSSGGVKSFVYDTEHDFYLTGIQPEFGTYKPNQVLQSFYLEDSETSLANKFVTKELNNGVVSRVYDMEFDSSGRLSSSKTIAGGNLISEMVYQY